MLYLYLNNNTIKILQLKKTLLKQEEANFFEKKYETNLLEKNKPVNVDLLASAIKETVSMISVKNHKDNQVILILPQEVFYFFRTEVPTDIAPSAIQSFVNDKASAILPIMPEELIYDYYVKNNNNQKVVTFFGISKDSFSLFQQALSLIDLKIVNIVPETLTFYKLFEKTLRTDKKENILYINLEKKYFSGYLFDNFGLIDEKKFFGQIEEESEYIQYLKQIINKLEENKVKVNRLIISGSQSENIRQDTFTKDVGVWTNPLKRIVPNFYDSYIKMLVVDKDKVFPVLIYDACFGAFIFEKEEKFSLLKNNAFKFKKGSLNLSKVNLPKKEIILFLSSFIISFVIFYLITNFGKNIKSPISLTNPTPTINPSPLPSLTPTPSFKKEDLKIQVLNGSGVAGKASEMKDILKKKGYSEIITGNADKFDYKTTEIQIKKDKYQAVNLIKEDLKDYLSIFKESSLEASKTPDIIIIIGSDFK
ncbi:MAG: hypothetical protein Fur009_5200 [Candidatus Microgenomates bacterium]